MSGGNLWFPLPRHLVMDILKLHFQGIVKDAFEQCVKVLVNHGFSFRLEPVVQEILIQLHEKLRDDFDDLMFGKSKANALLVSSMLQYRGTRGVLNKRMFSFLRAEKQRLVEPVEGVVLDRFLETDDISWLKIALRIAPGLLAHASIKTRANREIVLDVCSRSGRALRYASKQLQDDFEVVLRAVENDDGDNLMPRKRRTCTLNLPVYDPNDFQGKQHGMLTGSKASVLQFASPRLRGNHEIVTAAMKKNPASLLFAGDELRQDREILIHLQACSSKSESLETQTS